MLKVIEKTFDVVVIGSGGAGGAAASEAARRGANVLIVSKDPLVCSDSKISEGIITVRETGSPKDSESNLATNMRVEGSDLGDPDVVKTFAEDSVGAYEWLQRWGQRANRNKETGAPVNFALGGHNKARSVLHPQGGLDYAHSMWSAMLQSENQITCLEDAWCVEIITSEESGAKEVLGCLVYHAASGELWQVKAPSVVLACGGLSTLYFPHTDTMRGNTGDGYAIAARLGCELVDMEQVQFIPFALVGPKSYEGLVVGEPASAGPLGVLRDKDGNIIMDGIMRRNRAEVAAAIAIAVQEGKGTEKGGCYLDLTRNVEGKAGAMYYEMFNTLGHAFLSVVKSAQGPKAGAMKEPWEVAPSAHYCMGGVRVTGDGETVGQGAVKGLLAAGQVLGGLHGGNRLGSTSLAEGVIFGLRAGGKAADLATAKHKSETQVNEQKWLNASEKLQQAYLGLVGREGTIDSSELLIRLQKTAWDYLGPTRTGADLIKGQREIKAIRNKLDDVRISNNTPWNQSLIDYIELVNMLTTAELIVSSAIERPESVGAHVRLDAPKAKFLDRKPYSVVVRNADSASMLDEATHFQVTRVQRTPTPIVATLAQKASKQLAIKGLSWLYNQSQDRLDKILTKILKKRSVEMGVELTDPDAPPVEDFGIPLRLKKRITQTEDAVTFCFEALTGEKIDFLPGQFGNFVFKIDGESVMRSYSFSSSPTQKDSIDITIKREPGGLVSNWAIDKLQEGQTVRMKGPQGKFSIPLHGAAKPPKKIVLLGAGSGITPVMSMANWIVDSQAEVDVVFINSVRTSGDMIFSDEIPGLDQRHPSFSTCINYTGVESLPEGCDIKRTALGRINSELINTWVPDLKERHVFVCGPSEFMDSATEIVRELGLPKRKLHLEDFYGTVDLSSFADLGSFKVEFSRSNLTTESVPGESLLDLAEEKQLDTNFSCRSGTCGECKTRLLSGEVHMVNEEGLDASEKLSGHILTCTAVPLSDCQLDA